MWQACYCNLDEAREIAELTDECGMSETSEAGVLEEQCVSERPNGFKGGNSTCCISAATVD